MVEQLDHDGLAQLRRQLTNVDVGDRILRGRVELFKLNRMRGEPELSGSLLEISNNARWQQTSPLGPMVQNRAKILLFYLTRAIAHCFPENDYSHVTPDYFIYCDDNFKVMSTINGSCFCYVERLAPG